MTQLIKSVNNIPPYLCQSVRSLDQRGYLRRQQCFDSSDALCSLLFALSQVGISNHNT